MALAVSLPIVTPRTALAWSDLSEWILAARVIDRRRSSDLRHRQMSAHWNALPIEIVETADAADLEDFVSLIQTGPNLAWGKPPRGQRVGTKWERFNVAARNRLQRLAREADLASFGSGHNSRNAPELAA